MPEWLVGKTPQEAAEIANQLYQEVLRGAPTATTGQPGYRAQQPPPQTYGGSPPVAVPPTEEEWMQDAAKAMQKYTDYVEKTKFQPAMQQYGSTLAQQARSIAELRYPEEFRRFGPEIQMQLNQLAPEYMTPQNVELVVKMVKANHLEELARERADQEVKRRMESGQLLRPDSTQVTTAATPSSIDLMSDELPPGYRRVLARHNITPQLLDEFLGGPAGKEYGATMNERRKNWFELAKKGDVITEERFNVNG